MNRMDGYLTRRAVVSGMGGGTKRLLFQNLAVAAERAYDLDFEQVLDSICEREKLGSTGFGGGIAIPHGRMAALDRVMGVFARLAQPVDYDAIDGMPVDLVFMLVSPMSAGAEHLKALAQVSRRLRDPALLANLRGATDADALFALFAIGDARSAA